MATSKKVAIGPERCKGCELCANVCKKQLLSLSKEVNALGYYPIQLLLRDECNGCGLCVLMCPDVALYLEEVS